MSGERRSHAALDSSSRNPKARKIEALLRLDRRPGTVRLLEVGAGGGGISHYFGTHPSGRFDVDAVDVRDERTIVAGYRFCQVADTHLPFEDARFDVVVSNHVIEHVGDRASQRHHLAELGRVLKPGGIGYLAVPNRWMVLEPHYRLPFLSWLPRRWRSAYLRLARRGDFYDCEPLRLPELDRLLADAGLAWRHVEMEALRAMAGLEPASGWAARIAQRLPDAALATMRPVFPTLICTFSRTEARRG